MTDEPKLIERLLMASLFLLKIRRADLKSETFKPLDQRSRLIESSSSFRKLLRLSDLKITILSAN